MNRKYLRAAKKLFFQLKLNELCFILAKPWSHRIIHEDYVKARQKLNNFSPCPSGRSLTENKLLKPFQYDLQIIVPAYNVEKYLRDCMDSILRQETQYSYQIVLIDDGSMDKTGQIADEYANDSRVNVIHQKNKGFSGARNAGLCELSAEYVAFVDSDDMMIEGAIQALLNVAKKQDADIVEGGYFILEDGKLVLQPNVSEVQSAPPYGSLKGQPWGKVFRSSLFREICFPEGFWFEDSIGSFLLYPMAKSRYLIPENVYVYRMQPASITHTYANKPKSVDTYWITELLMQEHQSQGLSVGRDYYDQVIRQCLLNAKRVRKMSQEVQANVFILTSGLLKNYFKDASIQPTVHRAFQKALLTEDFGIYRLYCQTH